MDRCRHLQPSSRIALATALLGLTACAPSALSIKRPTESEDATSLRLRIVAPAEGERIQGDVLRVEVEYANEVSGITAQSFHAELNGRDYTAAFDQHSRGASGEIRAPGGLPIGDNTLSVEITDRSGNVARRTSRFLNAGAEWLAVTAVVRSNRRLEPLALSPDGRMLAAGTSNGTVRIWTLFGQDSQERASLKAHRGSVSALAFSPDGKLLASSGWDGAIHVWNVSGEQPKERAVLIGHSSTVSALAFRAEGTELVSGGWDGTTRVWKLGAGGRKDGTILTPQPRTNKVYAIALSPDGRTLACGEWEGVVRLWDVGSVRPRIRAALSGHLLKVHAIDFATDGMTLASGAVDKQIRLWDLSNGFPREQAVLDGHRAEIAGLAFIESGRLLSVARDGVRVWDVASHRTLNEIELPPSTRSFAIAAGGRHLAVGDERGTAYLLHRVEAHTERAPSNERAAVEKAGEMCIAD